MIANNFINVVKRCNIVSFADMHDKTYIILPKSMSFQTTRFKFITNVAGYQEATEKLTLLKIVLVTQAFMTLIKGA